MYEIHMYTDIELIRLLLSFIIFCTSLFILMYVPDKLDTKYIKGRDRLYFFVVLIIAIISMWSIPFTSNDNVIKTIKSDLVEYSFEEYQAEGGTKINNLIFVECDDSHTGNFYIKEGESVKLISSYMNGNNVTSNPLSNDSQKPYVEITEKQEGIYYCGVCIYAGDLKYQYDFYLPKEDALKFETVRQS